MRNNHQAELEGHIRQHIPPGNLADARKGAKVQIITFQTSFFQMVVVQTFTIE